MKRIRVKTLVVLGGLVAACLGAFIACDMVHFFETVKVTDPNAPGQQQPIPNPNVPAAVASIRSAYASITAVTSPKNDFSNIYSVNPDWIASAPAYEVGALLSAYENNGLQTLNFMRGLAGLDPVTIDPSKQEEAQAGAVMLAIVGYDNMDHNFSQVIASGNYWDATGGEVLNTDLSDLGRDSTMASNLYYSSENTVDLGDSVKGYMYDSDAENIEVLGHRRWCLNPPMSVTAFGRAVDDNDASYMTMLANDDNGLGAMPASGFVAWPSPENNGYFPAWVFAANQAWSVSLPTSGYDKMNVEGVVVTLTDVTTTSSLVEEFSVAAAGGFSYLPAIAGNSFFNIDIVVYGMDFCIIFRPSTSISLALGKKYSVLIKGLQLTGGGGMRQTSNTKSSFLV